MNHLTSLRNVTRRPVLQKVRHHTLSCAVSACKHRVSGSLSLPSRGSFHLSLTVLYAIGHQVVFSLMRWSSHIPTGFHVSCGTLDTRHLCHVFAYEAITPFRPVFQPCSTNNKRFMQVLNPEDKTPRFGLFRVRSPLLAQSLVYFLFLRVLRCFSSPGSLRICYIFTYGYRRITGGEFPHSDIYGSKLICSSP